MDINKIIKENIWHGQYVDIKEYKLGLKIEKGDKKRIKNIVLNKLVNYPKYYSNMEYKNEH